MENIPLAVLFGKLNLVAYEALESGTTLAQVAGNPQVCLEHWIVKCNELQDSDLNHVIDHFNIDRHTLKRHLRIALDRLPKEGGRLKAVDPELCWAAERAWLWATLKFSWPCIRTGHVLVGLLSTSSLARSLLSISDEFAKVEVDELVNHFKVIAEGSPEDSVGAKDGTPVIAKRITPKRDIFLCYRRSESKYIVGRIRDHLIREFGTERVFQDVETIVPGVDFANEIRSLIVTTRLMLVFIGPTWLTAVKEDGSARIQDENDFENSEIRWALNNSIDLIPLLLEGAEMPSESSLPEMLKPLRRFQHLEIRSDPDFHTDVNRLIHACRLLIVPR